MAHPTPALVALALGSELGVVTDLKQLIDSAAEHHMSGLLWTRVSRGEIEVAQEVKVQLASQDLVVRARHARLWESIANIRQRLAGLDVELAVLKGVPSEARWYDRMGERPCADLDLLINPSQTSQVLQVVALLQPDHPMQETFLSDFEKGLLHSVDLQVDGIAIDLHLDPLKLGPRSSGRELLWERTVYWQLPDGRGARVLDAEASLVHFLITLNRDCFCWMLGFSDIARLLARETIDWYAVEALTSSCGVNVPVSSTLQTVANILGLEVPLAPRSGWRAMTWRLVWRESVRLEGELGWWRHRHRNYLLPFLTDWPLSQSLRWLLRQFVLSRTVVASANMGLKGPWLWRLAAGRLRRLRARRRTIRRLRTQRSGPNRGRW